MFFHHFFSSPKDTGLLGKGCTCSKKKKIWGQRSFRGHLRSLNFNSQDMHYWLLHQHTALYSLQMYWVYWVGLVLKNIRTFWVLVSVMAFKQCQKLLKMHFCKFILYPLKRGLAGPPKRLKPSSFGGLVPSIPTRGPSAGPWTPRREARCSGREVGTITFAISRYFRFLFLFFFFYSEPFSCLIYVCQLHWY